VFVRLSIASFEAVLNENRPCGLPIAIVGKPNLVLQHGEFRIARYAELDRSYNPVPVTIVSALQAANAHYLDDVSYDEPKSVRNGQNGDPRQRPEYHA
jgi:hypothetical protein